MTQDLNLGRQLEQITGEMLLFGLLGKLIYTYPNRDWIQELLAEEVFSEAPFGETQPQVMEGLMLLHTWNQAALERPLADVVRELEEDCQNLLVGMREILAPPWESVYLTHERLLFQAPTIQVRQWYRRFGLEIENIGREPEDHMGLELIFVAHLASLATEALSQGDQTRYLELVQAQRDFLQEHLLKRAQLWCKDMIEHARTDFYRGAALMVRGALDETVLYLEQEARRLQP